MYEICKLIFSLETVVSMLLLFFCSCLTIKECRCGSTNTKRPAPCKELKPQKINSLEKSAIENWNSLLSSALERSGYIEPHGKLSVRWANWIVSYIIGRHAFFLFFGFHHNKDKLNRKGASGDKIYAAHTKYRKGTIQWNWNMQWQGVKKYARNYCIIIIFGEAKKKILKPDKTIKSRHTERKKRDLIWMWTILPSGIWSISLAKKSCLMIRYRSNCIEMMQLKNT